MLGVAWGRTVLALAENLPEKAMPDSCVVQVIGSQRSAYDGFTAQALGALHLLDKGRRP